MDEDDISKIKLHKYVSGEEKFTIIVRSVLISTYLIINSIQVGN